MTATVFITKINEVQNKIPDQDKYFTAPELNKLATENLVAKNHVHKT